MAVSSSAPVCEKEQIDQLASNIMGDRFSKIHSGNTVNSYRAALRYWFAWHQVRFGEAMRFPVSEVVVAQFIADHAALSGPARRAMFSRSDDARWNECNVDARQADGPLPPDIDEFLVDGGFKSKHGPSSLGTLAARLSALSSTHESLDLKNPCSHIRVRTLIAKVRKEYAKRGVAGRSPKPFTQQSLDAILATCDDSPIGRRDRALLLFAWEGGGRRRSEVVSATLENLRRLGPQHYVYVLPRSKTTRQPPGAKPLTGATAIAMDAWLEVRGLAKGPLFCSIRKSRKVSDGRLFPETIGKIVKSRCRQAGLPAADYSAHSLRSGFLANAGRRNIGLNAAMDLSGYRDFNQFARYYYQGDHALGREMPDLMKSDRPGPTDQTE